MNTTQRITHFLSIFLLLAVSISCTSQQPEQQAKETSTNIKSLDLNIPDQYKTGSFAIGAQAYTFNRYSVFEAIEKTAKAGGKVIELYPGQKLTPDDSDDRTLEPGVSEAVIQEVKDSLSAHNMMAVNFGVVGLPNDEERLRTVFDFAEKLGVKAITSEPAMEAMDLIESMVKEYDIPVAIHNHPPREDNPDYKHWDPEFVLSLVEGRDERVGVCADIGHYVRSDIKPTDALKLLEGRIISLHFTDVDQYGAEGEDVVVGNGVIDIPAVLAELERQNFAGHISIEFEANWMENMPDVAQFIGYVKGWADTKN